MIRAKFECFSVEKTRYSGDDENPLFVDLARFQVVISGSPENAEFFASTPSGYVELGTVKPGVFERGKTYFVDFTDAAPAAAEVPPPAPAPVETPEEAK